MARALQSIAIDAGQMFPAWTPDHIQHRPAVTLFSLIRAWRDYHGIATGDDQTTHRRRNAILDRIAETLPAAKRPRSASAAKP